MHTHHSHSKRRSTERAEIAQLLDPSYSGSSSSSPRKVFTDASGTIHDPEYRFFPTNEWEALRRKSFESDRDDEDENDEEYEYAFGGSRTRYVPTAGPSSPRLQTPHSPAFSSYMLTLPEQSSSPTNSFFASSPLAESPAKSSCSTPIRKLQSRLFSTRRPSHEIYDEDANWDDEEEDEDDDELVPPTPELVRDAPLQEEEQQHKVSSPIPSQHHDLRQKWQVLQLTVQFAIFRTNKRMKKTRVSF